MGVAKVLRYAVNGVKMINGGATAQCEVQLFS